MAFGDIVQTVSNTQEFAASVTVTISAATAGNLLVCCHFTGATDSTAPSGFSEAIAVSDGTNLDQGAIYYKIAAGGETSVTPGSGVSDENMATVMEIEGPWAASPLDQTTSNNATTESSTSSGTTGTTSQDDEFAVVLLTARATGAAFTSWTNSFTERGDVSTSAKTGATATKVLTAAGTVESTASHGSAVSMGAIATFKKALVATCALTGTATSSITESDIVTGGKTVILTLTNDTFIPTTISSTIAVRASVAWAVVTADSVVTLPTHQAGDRIYIFAVWKAFDTTAQISGWTEVTEFADGSVAAGANVGSVKVGCWYLDATSSSETNPTLDWSVSPVPGARCAITLSKGAGETWDAPTFVTAAISAATTWSATSSSTIDIKDGAIVLEVAGFRDDSSTMTRSATTALEDDGSPNVTWNGNVVENPATHASSTSSNDISADLIHRFVTTGATGVNLTANGDLLASETGTCLWVHQGVSSAVFDDIRQDIIDGLDSAQSEGTGWDAEVKAKLAVATVARTSDTVVTVTLSAQAAYDITAQETITATVPASSLTGGSLLVASPTFTVDTAGVASYTLNANAGVYALTGVTAGLKTARRVAAVTGSYTLTGTASGLKHGYVLGALTGVYLVTGVTAALRVSRSLVAVTGVYVVTGSASSLRRGFLLGANGGVYALNGLAAGLTVARRLVATPGVYLVSGVSAALLKGFTMLAVPGSYILTGLAASLRKGYRLLAGSGTHAINGSDANLTQGGGGGPTDKFWWNIFDR